jgi:hypothetical protein
MSDEIIIIKKRDHIHPDVVQESGLMNGNIDHMVSCPEKKISLFRRFDADR